MTAVAIAVATSDACADSLATVVSCANIDGSADYEAQASRDELTLRSPRTAWAARTLPSRWGYWLELAQPLLVLASGIDSLRADFGH